MKYLKTFTYFNESNVLESTAEERNIKKIFRSEVWKKIPTKDKDTLIRLREAVSSNRSEVNYLLNRGHDKYSPQVKNFSIKNNQYLKISKEIEQNYYDMYADLYNVLTNKTLTDLDNTLGVFEGLINSDYELNNKYFDKIKLIKSEAFVNCEILAEVKYNLYHDRGNNFPVSIAYRINNGDTHYRIEYFPTAKANDYVFFKNITEIESIKLREKFKPVFDEFVKLLNEYYPEYLSDKLLNTNIKTGVFEA